MIRFVFSPDWFLGIDSLFELVTVLVAFLIGVYSYKVYKFTKENSYKFFSYAFFLISFSYIIKILMSVSVYYPVTKIVKVGVFTFVTHTFKRLDLLYIIGFFTIRFLLLLGLIGLFMVLQKEEDRKHAFLLVYLAFISALLSNYLTNIFHVTASLILMLIFVYYYNNYLKYKSRNSFFVASSFFLIFISQIVFILMSVHPLFYVIGESVQLLGYALLLFALVLVLKK